MKLLNSVPQQVLVIKQIEALEKELHAGFQLQPSSQIVFGFVMKQSVLVKMKHDDHTYVKELTQGELFFIPSFVRCSITSASEDCASMMLFYCLIQADSEGGPSIFKAGSVKPGQTGIYHVRMPQVRQWVDEIMNEQSAGSAAFEFQLQSYVYAMAAALIQAGEQSAQTMREPEKDMIDYVLRTKQYMLKHYSEPMDMEELAHRSGASASRFYQSFKKYTGLSPLKFMNTVRLNESLQLLANAATTIMEAAHTVGYSDELYFSRVFKRQMGISPSQYKVAASKRIANLCPVFQGDFSVLGISPIVSLQRGWKDNPDRYMDEIKQVQPDIIFTSPVNPEIYEQLQHIAPVIVMKWKGVPWKERLIQIGDTLDLGSVAVRWLHYFDQKKENARQLIQRQMGRQPYLLIAAAAEQYRVFGLQMNKMKDLFYDDLGLTPPDSVHGFTYKDAFSLEELVELECENAVFLLPDTALQGGADKLTDEWRLLHKLTRKQRVFIIHYQESLLYNPAVHERLIDQIVDQLLRLS